MSNHPNRNPLALTDHTIYRWCEACGAKVVSDAAYEAMNGNYGPLTALGIDVRGVGPLHRITSIAHKLMSPDDRALDLAQATIDLARLPKP